MIEIVATCLATSTVLLCIACTVLASIVPYLYQRLSKLENKIDELDETIALLCKAANLDK